MSVIIPTYKRADKIVRAIESCLNQDYKNIEIIIVDDNGDNSKYRFETKNIIKPYIDNYSVRYIEHKKNLGGAEARNTGIKEATGFFVTFLDDDDEMYPNKISKQVELYNYVKDKNVGLIYCYCEVVDENGDHKKYIKCDLEGNPLYEHMLGGIAGTSLWFCPKHVLEKVGYFEKVPSKQDFILLLKILAEGYNIYRVPEALVKYYEHNDGRISGTSLNNIKGENIFRSYCRKYYYKLDCLDQILNVEYSFSERLLVLYLLNDLEKEARNELLSLIKIKPFNIKTYKSIVKYLFKNMYKKKLQKNFYV